MINITLVNMFLEGGGGTINLHITQIANSTTHEPPNQPYIPYLNCNLWIYFITL